MRIKTLLCLAALTAAGVTASMAQSNVYSLNVVGYVNLPIPGAGAYSVVANPLNNANNNITNLFGTGTPNGSTIIRWDPTLPDLAADQFLYTTSGGGRWLRNGDAGDPFGFILNPGEGVFFVADGGAPALYTNTFTGDVIQGTYTTPIFGQGTYNVISAHEPFGGNVTNSIQELVPVVGDSIYRWDSTLAVTDLSTNFLTWTASGGGQWVPNYPADPINVVPGEGFFYISDASAPSSRNWTSTYSVPQTP